jgi:hypothetical protein
MLEDLREAVGPVAAVRRVQVSFNRLDDASKHGKCYTPPGPQQVYNELCSLVHHLPAYTTSSKPHALVA